MVQHNTDGRILVVLEWVPTTDGPRKWAAAYRLITNATSLTAPDDDAAIGHCLSKPLTHHHTNQPNHPDR